MRRIGAFIIDYNIMCFLMRVVYYLIMGAWPIEVVIRGAKDTEVLIWNISGLITIYMYFFLSDLCFNGSSIGKKIARLKIQRKKQNRIKFALFHAALKLIFAFISFISLVIYLAKGRKMPYDSLFYISVD